MALSKHTLLNKLPNRRQLFPVFSLIVFIVYSWMFYRFFYQVPSWLYYMNAGNVLIVLAYILSYSLFESLVILACILVPCMIFPASFFKDKFVAQGSAQVLLISVISYQLRKNIQLFPKLDQWILLLIPVALLLVVIVSIVVFSLIMDRFQILPRLLNALAERITVFAYLYVPLGVIGTVVVLLRNLF